MTEFDVWSEGSIKNYFSVENFVMIFDKKMSYASKSNLYISKTKQVKPQKSGKICIW